MESGLDSEGGLILIRLYHGLKSRTSFAGSPLQVSLKFFQVADKGHPFSSKSFSLKQNWLMSL